MKISAKKLIGSLSLALALVGAEAQNAVKPQVFWLTNSTTFTMAGGGTNVANAGTATITSAPFPIFRGRGFVVNSECVGTNAGTAAQTLTFEFATPVTINGVSITNWSTYNTLAVAFPMNGTTRVFAFTNIATTVPGGDNITLGRLKSIGNAHTAYVQHSPTNTFISVIP